MSKKGEKIYPIGYSPPHETLEDSNTRNDLLNIILGDPELKQQLLAKIQKHL